MSVRYTQNYGPNGHRLRVWLLAFVTLIAPAAQAENHLVTPDTFYAAIAQAEPGDVLELAPGNYGVLSLRRMGGASNGQIVVRAADPQKPPVFTEMLIRQVNDLSFDGLLFDHTYEAGDPRHLRPFQVLDSTNITIRNSLFDGDVPRDMSVSDDGFGTAFGLGVTRTTGFVLEQSEIRTFFRGTVISDSSDIIVRENDLHDIRMDGMNFAQVNNVLIEGNNIHDFNRSLNSTDHADMIQFWTNGTNSPSTDIIIRNNILNSGYGWYTQSIFMRNDLVDRGLADSEMFYRNLTIEGNIILNAHLHGITVGETDNLVIQNNTVVRNATSQGEQDNPALWVPQIRVAEPSVNVIIQDNVTSKITGFTGQDSWLVDGNIFVQDASRIEPGFYGIMFNTEALQNPRNITAFTPLPGGPLDGAAVGAPQLRGN